MRGVYSRAVLLEQGIDERQLGELVLQGRLLPVRRGWFASPVASAAELEAVRQGGRLGCLGACKQYGLWVPGTRCASVVLPRHHRGRLPAGCYRTRNALPGVGLLPLDESLAQVVAHHDAEVALMVLESAVNGGHLAEADARALISAAPQRKRRTLDFFNPMAQSGSETRVRLFLQQRRFPVQAQVEIPGVGRVDLLVGRSLILECDSVEHHSNPNEDRRRDLGAIDLGYTPRRLSHEQIHVTWEETQEVLLWLLRSGQHLRPPVPR